MIEARDISIGYSGRVLASGLSFRVADGECVLLRGSNGSGKTTLLRTLAGTLKPVSGSLKTGKVIMVPTRIPKVKGFTVRDFVATATWHQAVSGTEEAAIARALESVGISGMAGRDISTLSDGEFQKACIAAALVRDADTLLLDEPTAFLDVESRIAVMELLKHIARGGRAVLFSSHDIYDAERICDRTISLSDHGR